MAACSNALVNYPNTFNRAKKVGANLQRSVEAHEPRAAPPGLLCCMQGRQIAVSSDAPVVMHPSGSVVQMFELYEGRLLHLLRGHMDTVNACCYNPTLQVQAAGLPDGDSTHDRSSCRPMMRASLCVQELYTGSNDCQIVVWGARDHAAEADTAETGMDEDNWSD